MIGKLDNATGVTQMGSSYVEYRGFGFWTRDAFLASWLRTLIAELERLPTLESWQKAMLDHWHVQAEIDAGIMVLGLDHYLTDHSRREFLFNIAQSASRRSELAGRRTSELFVDLLAGRLKTTVSSPIDYLDDP